MPPGILNISFLSEYLSMGVTVIGCLSRIEISDYALNFVVMYQQTSQKIILNKWKYCQIDATCTTLESTQHIKPIILFRNLVL